MFDVWLLRIGAKTERTDEIVRVKRQSPFPDRAGSTIAECIGSRSSQTFPTITESVATTLLTDTRSQQPSSSRQPLKVLGLLSNTGH